MTLYSPRGFVTELLSRQPVLGCFALLCLAGGMLTAAGSFLDARTIAGVSVWLKPTKFFLSIAVFAGTAAWFFGYVRRERRRSLLLGLTVAVLIGAAIFELSWISWQGAHGLRSHFNNDTPLYGTMYALMGVGAVLLVATTLPLAWEIARRPIDSIPPAYRLAVILGLVLTFCLGGTLGGTISAAGSSTVGNYSSSIPLFAWNQSGGDLRVAHFLGLHAMQALPLLAVAFRSIGWRGPVLVVFASLAWAALTIYFWMNARAGQPF